MRIGVDLGGTKVEFAAIADDGRIVARNRVQTPAGRYKATIEAVRDGVLALERHIGQSGTVGIGIPGSLSPSTGRVRNANSTCLNGNPLASDLEHALGRPVRLANDANCFALSEALDGAGKGFDSVFGVILGTGVGGGLVIGGTLMTGRNAIAGEWGHNPLPWPRPSEQDDRQCYCGQSGCIETHLSGPALSRAYRTASGNTVRAEEIARRANAGDPVASDVLAAYGHKLARALAQVINILDPDAIVLGGGLSNIEQLYDTVPALWQNWIFSESVGTILLPPQFGDSSGVRGAAWLWPVTS